ncbi:hypothetical protein [Eisenbergiella tayi]|nr:hypothetical protein [Eisenbergiella tayi]
MTHWDIKIFALLAKVAGQKIKSWYAETKRGDFTDCRLETF